MTTSSSFQHLSLQFSLIAMRNVCATRTLPIGGPGIWICLGHGTYLNTSLPWRE